MDKILAIDWLTYIQDILQSSYVGPFDVVGPRHLPTMCIPLSGPDSVCVCVCVCVFAR